MNTTENQSQQLDKEIKWLKIVYLNLKMLNSLITIPLFVVLVCVIAAKWERLISLLQ